MNLKGVSTQQLVKIFKQCSFYKDWLMIMNFSSREEEQDFYRNNDCRKWIEICFRKVNNLTFNYYGNYVCENNEKWVNFCNTLDIVYLEKYLTFRDFEYIDKVILHPDLSSLADCDGRIELEFD